LMIVHSACIVPAEASNFEQDNRASLSLCGEYG
jgi:hypothetical protein